MNGLAEENSQASQPPRDYVVMKFGGTSVEDAAAIRLLCGLVQRPSSRHPVVVVSALAKVTDQLMNAGWTAAAGDLEPAREILQLLRQRHEAVARGLAKGNERRRLCREFATEFKAADKMVVTIASEMAFAPCSQDKLLGVGESLSSKLVQSALQAAGVELNAVSPVGVQRRDKETRRTGKPESVSAIGYDARHLAAIIDDIIHRHAAGALLRSAA